MNIKELVARVKETSPGLANMPDARAVALLRAAFAQIAAEIDATEEGVVKVLGLGNFRVRQVDVEKGGTKTRVKRVVFGRPKGPGARAKAAQS